MDKIQICDTNPDNNNYPGTILTIGQVYHWPARRGGRDDRGQFLKPYKLLVSRYSG